MDKTMTVETPEKHNLMSNKEKAEIILSWAKNVLSNITEEVIRLTGELAGLNASNEAYREAVKDEYMGNIPPRYEQNIKNAEDRLNRANTRRMRAIELQDFVIETFIKPLEK